jgi:tRNA C32,U32 (ribose-2'-O)-methylase TrmJ
MQHPGLKWTFWIIVALILLFVLTQMKRKQRVIPQVNTPVNATGDFVQSISRLYYQNKNNKQIAEKMISYFYESLRNKYFINIPAHDERFLQQLLEKSEGSTEDMNTLVGLIEMIHAQEKVSDEELRELNKRIENFNTTIR